MLKTGKDRRVELNFFGESFESCVDLGMGERRLSGEIGGKE